MLSVYDEEHAEARPRAGYDRSVNRFRVVWLTGAALVAFACNSLLCRAALRSGAIDPRCDTSLVQGMRGERVKKREAGRSHEGPAPLHTAPDYFAAVFFDIVFTCLMIESMSRFHCASSACIPLSTVLAWRL
jgi:hypothetical protein